MRYAKIVNEEISNGTGVGVSIFFQGCHFHCKNCFNPETWDYKGGNEWTEKTDDALRELISKPYIKRVSLLGGEPMDQSHYVFAISYFVHAYRDDIKIWLYTGYTFEDILNNPEKTLDISGVDVMVDGQFIEELKDLSLPFRGSSNQRIIDVQESLRNKNVILWQLS